jgi:hypothetical protein
MMKKEFIYLLLVITFICGIQVEALFGQTYCNPLNLSRQFSLDPKSNDEIADPTIVLYKENYFLFATNAGGYWYSGNLLSWKFISGANLPLDKMAPTAVVIGDWLYFFTSFNDKIYRSNDPASGNWEEYTSSLLISLLSDFAVFADTDGKVYCYYGCSNNDGVMARELDANNLFNPLGVAEVCRKANPMDDSRKKLKANSDVVNSYNVKGSWMNKYNGKYYYQCTERIDDLNNYGDVVYVSDKPMGPFTFAANNPFSYRPNGFVCGAGNGSTFADKYGNWWHIATLTSQKNIKSQSTLGLFPAGFDEDGNLYAKTDFGDYPIFMPTSKYSNISKLDPEWSLLSDDLTAQASSTLATCPVTFAFDENIGTFWSAQSGEKGEWLSVDLGSLCTINAFQINFAENGTTISGGAGVFAHQYLVEYSIDKLTWIKLSDKTSNTEYLPNDYEALRIPLQAQYLRITNYRVPSGTFAISGFRIFGSGTNRAPKKINTFRAIRDYRNSQVVKMSWEKQANTSGYNIRYGTDKDKLYHSYQVFKNTRLTIRCPDRNKTYWFEIDAFNDSGITPGKLLILK